MNKTNLLIFLMGFLLALSLCVFVYTYQTMKEVELYRYHNSNSR